jgi:hypothetical protein
MALAGVLPACGGSGSTDMTQPSGVPLSHLSLFPARLVAIVGEPISLTVVARDVNGAEVSNVVPAYSSSNPGVVRVDPDGTTSSPISRSTGRWWTSTRRRPAPSG